MKGLLIKDLKLLKNQKTFLAIIVLISGGFIFTGENQAGAVAYITMMLSVLVITTIGYDEQGNGFGFLFTLPVSRTGYVLEKYVLGIIMPFLGIAVGTLLTVLSSLVRTVSYDKGEWMFTVLASFLLAVVMQAVTIPIQLKFGAERSRIAMLVSVGMVVCLAYIVWTIGEYQGIDLDALSAYMVRRKPWVATCAGIAAAVLLMGLSFLISVKIMKEKQF